MPNDAMVYRRFGNDRFVFFDSMQVLCAEFPEPLLRGIAGNGF